MAKGWQQNSQWRQSALQGAMWLILGATVGLAALVTHHRRMALHVDLGPPVKLGDVSIRLPAGWAVTRSAPRGMSQLLEAVDKTSDDGSPTGAPTNAAGGTPLAPSRQIDVLSQQIPAPMQPVKYLQYVGILPSADSPSSIRGAPRILGPIEFGPGGGLLLDASVIIVQGNNQGIEKNIVACTILPWRQAVTIRLKGAGPPEARDEQIVRQVAASLSTNVIPAPISQLTLPNNIRVGLPDDYKAIVENDPLVTERQALLETPDGRWASLTLVPCILFPGEKEQAIKTLLTARGLQWWIAVNTVHARNSAASEYEFGPLVETSSGLVTRGYFKAAPNGLGLMAFFHGATSELPSFEPAWEQLLSRTQIDQNFKPRQLLAASATELTRLAKGEHVAIPALGSSDWWLWRHVASDWNYGWSRTTYSDAQAAAGVYESRWKSKDDLPHATGVTISWNTDFPTHVYQWNMDRREMQPGKEPQEAFTQSVRFEPGRFTSTISSIFSSKPILLPGSVPQGFIQGTFLPLLLGRLSGPPLVVRTDLFADEEGVPMLDPFTLIIHPSVSPATNPATAASTPPATLPTDLREMLIEVNGSGRMSRWYFKPDGSIACIDFPGGFRRERTDGHRIHELFDQDAQLRP